MSDDPDVPGELDPSEIPLIRDRIGELQEIEQLLYTVRGKCIDLANSIDAMLGTLITFHFFKNDPADTTQRKLNDWHSLVLSHLSTTDRITAFRGILKSARELNDNERNLLAQLTEANRRRNEIAHSTIGNSLTLYSMEPYISQTRFGRAGFSFKRVELDDALEDLRTIRTAFDGLSAHISAVLAIPSPHSEDQ